ncbi:MAG TPA: DUF424 family protein [Methanothrix sp.]|nr:DUF424 family protein [Methanothrix sp.]
MNDIPQASKREDADDGEMYLKSYQQGREVLVAVCDCAVLGKKFTEGRLKIEVDPEFFGGEKASCAEVEAALASATMANFVGSKTIEHAISLGYVERDNVLSLQGVPYAQMVRM